MIKKPFFGFARPKLTYANISGLNQAQVTEIPLPEKITLLLTDDDIHPRDLTLGPGAEVRTGEKFPISGGKKGYVATPATGRVAAVFENSTYSDYRVIGVTIDVEERDTWDVGFTDAAEAPDPQTAREFLSRIPGVPDLSLIMSFEKPVHTLIINGIDQDLLVATNSFLLSTEAPAIKEGVDYLKALTDNAQIILVAAPELRTQAEKTGAEIKIIEPVYPKALPWFTARDLLDRDIPVTTPLTDLGVAVITVETVLALKTAFGDKRPPVEKVISVIHKDDRVSCVRTRIGTPVKDVLAALDISTHEGDRIVFGGPMTGHSVYSDEMPVMHTTDAIFVQDKDQVIPPSDSPCVNCGECVRACPARLPVNMLVRLLENRLYEEAAQNYDLMSCVECGLCSYVCMLHIPVFHYIMLGKHELALQQAVEESDGE